MKHKHSATTLNLDLTGDQRKGKIKSTFGVGIQKEKRLKKFTILKQA